MYLILSDIHANLAALEAVMKDASERYILEGVLLLGDSIDYGMHSNEVIAKIKQFEAPIVCNLWGNHEKAIMEEDYSQFSTERGKLSAKNTAKTLSEESRQYLQNFCNHNGKLEFDLGKHKCIAFHGSKEDCFWSSIEPHNIRGDYHQYDIVFSGHSHKSHCFTECYETDCVTLRNKKPTAFINPGSVGQPRNRNPKAQYAMIDPDSMTVHLQAVAYEIEVEQGFFTEEVDEFYKQRLTYGI